MYYYILNSKTYKATFPTGSTKGKPRVYNRLPHPINYNTLFAVEE